MRESLPGLLVAVPLAGAALVPLIGALFRRGARETALVLHAGVFAIALALFALVQDGAPIAYAMGGWPGPWGIELRLDGLSALMALLTAGMACFAAPLDLSGRRSGAAGGRTSPFGDSLLRGVLLLLLAGLLGIVATRDLFNLFVFMEISSLAAYTLIAAGGGKATIAAFRYLLAGTAAGSLYLFGVGFLYALTGTLNMDDLPVQLAAAAPGAALATGVTLIAIGLSIKAALFPLHGWLPDVYVFAPTATTGFIAAVMAKVSAYALLRLLGETLFGVEAGAFVLDVLLWLGIGGVLVGGALAIAQTDVARMLAWSSISAMGTILIAVAVGSELAVTAALFHVVAHALAKGCFFFAAGALAGGLGLSRVQSWAGLASRLPGTAVAVTVAAFSLIGLPPVAGFFSKYLLLAATWNAGGAAGAAAFAALIASSLLAAVYLFRVLEAVWFRSPAQGSLLAEAPRTGPERLRLPRPLVFAVGALAALTLAGGLFAAAVERRLPRWPLPEPVGAASDLSRLDSARQEGAGTPGRRVLR